MARTAHTERTHIGPESYPEQTLLPPVEELEGMEVCDSGGEKVGKVDTVYVDNATGYLRYVAVATGWFGRKHHVVPIDDVQTEFDGDRAYLALPYDEDRLKEGPSYEPDDDSSITRAEESRIYGHYGRTAYWDEVRTRQTPPAATPEIAGAEVQAAMDRGDDPSSVRVKRWGV